MLQEDREKLAEVVYKWQKEEDIETVLFCALCKAGLRHIHKENEPAGYICPKCGMEWLWQ